MLGAAQKYGYVCVVGHFKAQTAPQGPTNRPPGLTQRLPFPSKVAPNESLGHLVGPFLAPGDPRRLTQRFRFLPELAQRTDPAIAFCLQSDPQRIAGSAGFGSSLFLQTRRNRHRLSRRTTGALLLRPLRRQSSTLSHRHGAARDRGAKQSHRDLAASISPQRQNKSP